MEILLVGIGGGQPPAPGEFPPGSGTADSCSEDESHPSLPQRERRCGFHLERGIATCAPHEVTLRSTGA